MEMAIVAALIGGVASYYWARREGRRAWLVSVVGAILTFGIMRKFVPAFVDIWRLWRRATWEALDRAGSPPRLVLFLVPVSSRALGVSLGRPGRPRPRRRRHPRARRPGCREARLRERIGKRERSWTTRSRPTRK